MCDSELLQPVVRSFNTLEILEIGYGWLKICLLPLFLSHRKATTFLNESNHSIFACALQH